VKATIDGILASRVKTAAIDRLHATGIPMESKPINANTKIKIGI
jgi:hypothetical protein